MSMYICICVYIYIYICIFQSIYLFIILFIYLFISGRAGLGEPANQGRGQQVEARPQGRFLVNVVFSQPKTYVYLSMDGAVSEIYGIESLFLGKTTYIDILKSTDRFLVANDHRISYDLYFG